MNQGPTVFQNNIRTLVCYLSYYLHVNRQTTLKSITNHVAYDLLTTAKEFCFVFVNVNTKKHLTYQRKSKVVVSIPAYS